MELWPLSWRDEVIFNSSLPSVTGGGSAHGGKNTLMFFCVWGVSGKSFSRTWSIFGRTGPASSQCYLHSVCVHGLRLYLIMVLWWQACRIVKIVQKEKNVWTPQRRDEAFLSQGGTFPEREATLCGPAHQTNARTNTSTAASTQHKDALNSFFYSVSACLLSFSGGCLDHVMCQIYGGPQSSRELMKAGGWSLYYRHDGEIKSHTRQAYQRRCRWSQVCRSSTLNLLITRIHVCVTEGAKLSWRWR